MRTVKSILLLIFMITTILLTSFENNLHLILESFEEDSISKWIEWAKIAWSYYEPGVGVDPSTGILRAGYRWPYLTDWDLGGYIVATIKAELMGILPKEGAWGADDRIDRVLRFLETRIVSPYGIPYRLYSSVDGKPVGKDVTNVSDAGRLLIALALLKKYRPDLAERIDEIVKRNGYRMLANSTEAWKTTLGFYKYYVAHGFKFFGFDNAYPVQRALNEFEKIKNGPHVNVFGIELPVTEVTSEPMLHTVFELDVGKDYMEYLERVYKVQEARYRATGKLTAWSEGNTGLGDVTYVYEWIVTPRGEIWKITPKEVTPIVFTKVAFGFHALYNTDYTRSLVEYLIKKDEERRNSLPFILFLPAKGFIEGVDESGRIVGEIIDKTQTLIISAAYYALKKVVLESGEIAIETSSEKYTIGEKVAVDILYLDKSNLKHTCSWNITIKDAQGASHFKKRNGPECKLTIEWTPEKPGTYVIEARVLADYVLFNNTLNKNFNINVGKPANVQKEIHIIRVLYPDKVIVGEEFNIKVTVGYDVDGEETLVMLVLQDPSRNLLVKSDPTKIINSGSLEFTLRLRASEEGLMTLKLHLSYTVGEEWIDTPMVTEISIDVLRDVAETVTKTLKELIYVTKTSIVKETQTITITRNLTLIVTTSGSWWEVVDIKVVLIIAISIILLTLATIFILLSSRRTGGKVRSTL